MNDFKEWLSDRLIYFMLGGAALIVILVLFFGVRACTHRKDGVDMVAADKGQQTEAQKVDDGSTLDRNMMPAVNSFIQDYYQAKTDGDIEKIRSLMINLTSDEEQKIKDAKKSITRYQVLDVYTAPGLNDKEFLVYVSYEYYLDGIATPVPAVSQLYLVTEPDGTFKIVGDVASKPDIMDYMNKYTQSDAVQAVISEIQVAYNGALQSDPALRAYFNALNGKEDENEDAISLPCQMVANDQANVRSAPEDGEIIGTLAPGDSVTVTTVNGDWYMIEYNGVPAFVHGSLLDVDK